TLVQAGTVLSSGENFTANGSFLSAIACLQSDLAGEKMCGLNWEGCTLIEMSLINPESGQPRSGSSTDISLITPHNFTAPARFRYFNGCDGNVTECLQANCSTTFHASDDGWVHVGCQEDDVNLEVFPWREDVFQAHHFKIIFCP
ncbi:hypothetical protein B0H13DRAFT_1598929, partial [Mycena leptocephala]